MGWSVSVGWLHASFNFASMAMPLAQNPDQSEREETPAHGPILRPSRTPVSISLSHSWSTAITFETRVNFLASRSMGMGETSGEEVGQNGPSHRLYLFTSVC